MDKAARDKITGGSSTTPCKERYLFLVPTAWECRSPVRVRSGFWAELGEKEKEKEITFSGVFFLVLSQDALLSEFLLSDSLSHSRYHWEIEREKSQESHYHLTGRFSGITSPPSLSATIYFLEDSDNCICILSRFLVEIWRDKLWLAFWLKPSF